MKNGLSSDKCLWAEIGLVYGLKLNSQTESLSLVLRFCQKNNYLFLGGLKHFPYV